MKSEPNQNQQFIDICRQEMEAANARIASRLSEVTPKPGGNRKDEMEGIRRLYEELADKEWTETDETCLSSLGESSEIQIKGMIRDAFRHSPVLPVPSFRYLVSLAKKLQSEPPRPPAPSNPEYLTSYEREVLANVLSEHLRNAGDSIVKKLDLDEGRASLVHESLEDAQGNIVSHFSPLV